MVVARLLFMSDQERGGLHLTLEYIDEQQKDAVVSDLEHRPGEAPLIRTFVAVRDAIDPAHHPKTRVVFSGDFIQSVQDRDDSGREYIVERGAGMVAAKTMPPNDEGFVDVLIPIFWVLPLEDAEEEAGRPQLIAHVAAHEAVHASIHHLDADPFDVYKRRDLRYATLQYTAMAGEQAEEYLAECLSSLVVPSSPQATAEQVTASFEAFEKSLNEKLPAVDKADPESFQKGMEITFEALHIFWKALAYMAAELRHEDGTFALVPQEVTDLAVWKGSVASWWGEYTALLGRIPMSVDPNIAVVEQTVVELAALLQRWAYGLGFDFHDEGDGGYFRILLWD